MNSQMNPLEREVRNDFNTFIGDIVTKDGGATKKDKSIEAMKVRKKAAIRGAKEFKKKFGDNSFEKLRQESFETL